MMSTEFESSLDGLIGIGVDECEPAANQSQPAESSLY